MKTSATRLQHLAPRYRRGLLDDTLPFWSRHAVDHDQGGFFSALDRDGSLVDDDKAVWIQARCTWLWGELYNTVEPREEWLRLARHGADFLLRHAFDPADGRMWFHLTRDGRPLRKRRYAFSESFAAIAFGELARATGDDAYARRAEACFHAFVRHHTTPGAAPPKFTAVRPLKSIGFPMITIHTAQQLRESIGWGEAEQAIDRAIAEIEHDFVRPELECVLENVGLDGEVVDHFDGRLLNPGHAIEGAWFILCEAARRQDSRLEQLGCRMLDWMWQRGHDDEYGGLYYFRDLHGKPVAEYWHDMKFWWPQCEALIATLLAYLLTDQDRYAAWHLQLHDWCQQHFADPEHGEWFGYLHRDGRRSSSLKGSLWKGPFHLPRMQLICWLLLERREAAWAHF